MTIAGHTFVEDINGRICPTCGKTWAFILARREFWREREPGIAHYGDLSATEVEQLNAELDRIWGLVVASARTRGGA